MHKRVMILLIHMLHTSHLVDPETFHTTQPLVPELCQLSINLQPIDVVPPHLLVKTRCESALQPRADSFKEAGRTYEHPLQDLHGQDEQR